MIKKELKKIFKLANIFLKDSYQNLDIINSDNRINKKSIFLWMMVFLFIGILYISNSGIKFLVQKGQAESFINIYFLVLSIIVMFQAILVCTNIFYFSKDLEYILPLPIKPKELLISKFIALIYKIYISEIIFGGIPIIVYGIYTNASILFYIYTILIFIIFPIFFALLISIIMMFVMKISRFIRNKDVFQIIITLALISILFFVEYKLIGNIFINNNGENFTQDQFVQKVSELSKRVKESNKYFLVINPSIDALNKSNFLSIFDIIKIIFIDIIAFILFVFIGKMTYLKDILKNTNYLSNKKNKKTNLIKKCKKKSISKAYISKEFKNLFRNPMFFIQCVYPVLIFTITIAIMVIILLPTVKEIIASEEFKNQVGDISFDITGVYLIIGVMQFLFMMSTASLTGFSREGKNAIFVKYIPISYYKQFIYKGLPQIFINSFSVLIITLIAHFAISSIEIKHIISIFILGFLLNIINSYTMLIIDLLNPKLEWDTEYDVLKQNNNKIFQYGFTAIIILLLVYFSNIFESINVDKAVLFTGIIFIIIILGLNIIVKIKQNKLFKKII